MTTAEVEVNAMALASAVQTCGLNAHCLRWRGPPSTDVHEPALAATHIATVAHRAVRRLS